VINFQASYRYDNSAVRPAVAFISRTQAVELHTSGALRFSVGTLRNRDLIDWSTPQVISTNNSNFSTPAVTVNGEVIVSVFEKSAGELWFSLANVN
jgi:hypothetical protein